MSDTSNKINFKKIFLFWIPLAATWVMMSVEGPFLAALIARMPEPKFNLAAYGVAFSFALIIEAPVIMMMSASTALVKDQFSFLRLKNFAYALNWGITFLMIIFIIPPLFYFVVQDLVGLPDEVASLTHIATIILIPWPGTIGYRRFYQGILIRYNLTRRVAYGTIIRLGSMAATGLFFYLLTEVHGVVVGAAALSVGVTCEAAASKIMALRILKQLESKSNETLGIKLSYKKIYDFYYPLALTSLITLGVHPLVTFFIGQSRMAIESLAVLPVINSFVFIFRSFGLSFQEVGIALMGDKKENYKSLRNFAFTLGIIVVVSLGIVSLTPLADLWLHDVSGLTIELTHFSKLPLLIMTIMPGLTVLISFQRAVLIQSDRTKPITWATVTEFVGIIIVLFIAINYFDAVGVVAATTAFIIGRLGANIYLAPPYIKSLKQN